MVLEYTSHIYQGAETLVGSDCFSVEEHAEFIFYVDGGSGMFLWTSVNTCKSRRYRNPEDHSVNSHYHENLKSH